MREVPRTNFTVISSPLTLPFTHRHTSQDVYRHVIPARRPTCDGPVDTTDAPLGSTLSNSTLELARASAGPRSCQLLDFMESCTWACLLRILGPDGPTRNRQPGKCSASATAWSCRCAPPPRPDHRGVVVAPPLPALITVELSGLTRGTDLPEHTAPCTTTVCRVVLFPPTPAPLYAESIASYAADPAGPFYCMQSLLLHTPPTPSARFPLRRRGGLRQQRVDQILVPTGYPNYTIWRGNG